MSNRRGELKRETAKETVERFLELAEEKKLTPDIQLQLSGRSKVGVVRLLNADNTVFDLEKYPCSPLNLANFNHSFVGLTTESSKHVAIMILTKRLQVKSS